jgi:hypothetical protein
MPGIWNAARIAALKAPAQIAPDLYINPPLTVEHLNLGNPFGDHLDRAETIMPMLPNVGFGYSFADGFTHKMKAAFGVGRLINIKQFGFLEDFSTATGNPPSVASFYHTRLVHSLDVLVIANLIIANNQTWFDGQSGLADAFRIVALTHDIATSAGGDTMKIVDHKTFDEEQNYNVYLNKEAAQKFCREHSVDTDLLVRAVQGEGVLGALLDIADKIAYVARDIEIFLGHPDHVDSLRLALTHTTRGNAYVCGLWSEVRIEKNMPYFTDQENLRRFLEARAHLFRNLYTHPTSRAKRTVVYALAAAFALDQRLMTVTELLHGGDHELVLRCNEILGELFWDGLAVWEKAEHQAFATPSEAREFQLGLIDEGILFCLMEDARAFFKPGTNLMVRQNGLLMSLAEADPVSAAEIERHGQPIDPIRVYYLPDFRPRLTGYAESFVAWRRQWRT